MLQVALTPPLCGADEHHENAGDVEPEIEVHHRRRGTEADGRAATGDCLNLGKKGCGEAALRVRCQKFGIERSYLSAPENMGATNSSSTDWAITNPPLLGEAPHFVTCNSPQQPPGYRGCLRIGGTTPKIHTTASCKRE